MEQNRFSTLDSSVKNKIDTTYGEITGKLTTLSTDFKTLMTKHEEEHARLELLLTKLDGILGGLGPLPDKLYKQCDRIESLIRERTGSVQEDVNRLMGSQGQQHRDEVLSPEDTHACLGKCSGGNGRHGGCHVQTARGLGRHHKPPWLGATPGHGGRDYCAFAVDRSDANGGGSEQQVASSAEACAVWFANEWASGCHIFQWPHHAHTRGRIPWISFPANAWGLPTQLG